MKTRRQSRGHTQAITSFTPARTGLLIATLPEKGLQDKLGQPLSLGLRQDGLPVSQLEELLQTSHRWDQRERKLTRVAMVYCLLGLHV